MEELYNKLKNHTLNEAIKIEENDRQYIALKNMWENFKWDRDIYLSLILANSIICYQLSWKWEDYWEEFSAYFVSKIIVNSEEWIVSSLATFIKQSKNNKRFVDVKSNRLEKLKPFLKEFLWKTEYYYENMEELVDKLAKTMNQKKDAKTIVFAVKMFSYWARNAFDRLVYFPENIAIPIDSRLENLYERYCEYPPLTPPYKGGGQAQEIKKFYFDLSKKLNIPELHLDAIVWVNYEELIK